MTICSSEQLNLVAALAVKHGFAGDWNHDQHDVFCELRNQLLMAAERGHQPFELPTYFEVHPDAYLPVQKVNAIIDFTEACHDPAEYRDIDRMTAKLLRAVCKTLEGYGAPSAELWTPSIHANQQSRYEAR